MITITEAYDIVNDKQCVRILIYNKYALHLDDQMTIEQISTSFKKMAELIDADTGTKKTD